MWKCLCGMKNIQAYGPGVGLEFAGDEDDDQDVEESLRASRPHLAPDFLCFSAALDQPLRGVPIKEGQLWYITSEQHMEQVQFALFINGFGFVSGEREINVAFSPFCVVRNCKVSDPNTSGGNQLLSQLRVFKISLFSHGVNYYFATGDEDSRNDWVSHISHVLRTITQSLFPRFRLRCEPIEKKASTTTRLLAGYLVRDDGVSCQTPGPVGSRNTVSVIYCELHSHKDSHAVVRLYENEYCEVQLAELSLNENSLACEMPGLNCSCFCIEAQHFSSRTMSERKLWLRAISNVKVKLQNKAPPPDATQLQHFRYAIKEHINSIQASLEAPIAADPLLARLPRRWSPFQAGAPIHLPPSRGPLSPSSPQMRPQGGEQRDRPPNPMGDHSGASTPWTPGGDESVRGGGPPDPAKDLSTLTASEDTGDDRNKRHAVGVGQGALPVGVPPPSTTSLPSAASSPSSPPHSGSSRSQHCNGSATDQPVTEGSFSSRSSRRAPLMIGVRGGAFSPSTVADGGSNGEAAAAAAAAERASLTPVTERAVDTYLDIALERRGGVGLGSRKQFLPESVALSPRPLQGTPVSFPPSSRAKPAILSPRPPSAASSSGRSPSTRPAAQCADSPVKDNDQGGWAEEDRGNIEVSP
mmetsp:Transcript_11899/g.28544  ORF Transcript_11899/g.28544 Transcript_11899/m.28544 type:complete len:640 (-) Transcript_11899:70-1989(-)